MGCEDSAWCEYKSTKFMRVRSPKLVATYYTVLVGVLMYVVFYTIFWNKGYQATDSVVGTSSAKLKGTASTGNFSNFEDAVMYDAMDLVVPANEENAFFVTTSQVVTKNQTRGYCDGNSDTGNCTDGCVANEYNADSQGILTGECSDNNGFCQVLGWCPLEVDSNPEALNNVGNFTAFVKIDIEFPLWGYTRSNTIDRNGDGSPIDGYNLFTVNDMLSRATGGSVSDTSEIATEGAIILMTSVWDCNLDDDIDKCNPHYKFKRIDSESDSISYGYNFRTVSYDINQESRLLRKLIGVRVVLITEGTGGKFDFATLTITFGAGLAYLGVAKIITDLVLENFLPKSKHYATIKNRMVEDNELLSGDSMHSYFRRKGLAGLEDPPAKNVIQSASQGQSHSRGQFEDSQNLHVAGGESNNNDKYSRMLD